MPFTATQAPCPNTSTLFFLGTSESTKNRPRRSRIEDGGSRIEDRLTLNGAILDSLSSILHLRSSILDPRSSIRRALLTGAELASFNNECSSNRERSEEYETNVAKG